jgi:drug/metabolite transporter (DMT)-like permease
MSRRHVLMLLLLAAIWGSSFMFIKVAVRELEPGALVFWRLLLATLTLVVLVSSRMSLREAGAHVVRLLLPFSVVAVLNAAVPFWLLAWAETRIDSGLAAVIQAAAPLFTALLAFFFFHSERVAGLRLLGVVGGFGGVALLVGVSPEGSVLAALAVVLTALCYAASALIAGKSLRGAPPLVVALGTTVLATLFSAPLGIAQTPADVPGWKVLGSVATLGVLGLGLAYGLYFGLISGAGASRAMLVTYLVPPMALFYGAAILDEPVTASAIAGLALVLVGVALGSGSIRALRRRGVDTVKA